MKASVAVSHGGSKSHPSSELGSGSQWASVLASKSKARTISRVRDVS